MAISMGLANESTDLLSTITGIYIITSHDLFMVFFKKMFGSPETNFSFFLDEEVMSNIPHQLYYIIIPI
jgi:hypothetical protein